MKKKRLTLIFSALLWAVSGTVAGQEISYIPALKGPSRCVRQYIGNHTPFYINDATIYYVEYNGSNFFVFYDISNPSTAIVSPLPQGYSVGEFEILNDTVYFCGTFTNSGNPLGIVGFISVNDLFFYNGTYTIGHINPLQEPSGYVTPAHFSSFDRMDLYVDANGVTHFAVVGQLEHTFIIGESRRSAADIWYDSNHLWKGCALNQKHNPNLPTDITCTNNFVVVSGTTTDETMPLFMVFEKRPGFPKYPIMDTLNVLKDALYCSPVLVERLQGNDIAMAYYYSSDAGNGTSIHYFNDIANIPMTGSTTSSFYYSPSRSFLPYKPYDLRFNTASNRLLMPQLTDLPSTNTLLSNIIQIDFSGTYHNLWTTQYADIQSADNHIIPHFSAGGEVSLYCLLSINRDFSRTPCFEFDPLSPTSTEVTLFKGPFEDHILFISNSDVSENDSSFTVSVTNLCSDSKSEEK